MFYLSLHNSLYCRIHSKKFFEKLKSICKVVEGLKRDASSTVPSQSLLNVPEQSCIRSSATNDRFLEAKRLGEGTKEKSLCVSLKAI